MHVHDPVALTAQPDLSSPDGHKFLSLLDELRVWDFANCQTT